MYFDAKETDEDVSTLLLLLLRLLFTIIHRYVIWKKAGPGSSSFMRYSGMYLELCGKFCKDFEMVMHRCK